LSANPSIPATSLEQLLALARSKTGGLSYASWGNGSVSHLASAMLMTPVGIKMVHVPFKGVNPALLEVMAGRVDTLFISIASAGDNFSSGKVRPIAISSKTRSPLLPNLPTIAESGYPDFEVSTW
jgi:tripartite-type tricarboxylate transporter receptor subunit TctC